MVSTRTLKEYGSLKEKKHREERGQFLAEGFRLVQDAVSSDVPVACVLHTAEFSRTSEHRDFLEALRMRGTDVEEVPVKQFRGLSDTVTSQGIIAVVRRRSWSITELLEAGKDHQVLVALDGVSDPGNLGVLIRTCDWFAVDGLLLGRGTVDAHNPKVVRSSMGAIFHVPLVECVDLVPALRDLQRRAFAVVVTDLAGETFHYDVQHPPRVVIVLGNEAWGVRAELRDLADARVRIKGYGRAESLNVSVACGVMLSVLKER